MKNIHLLPTDKSSRLSIKDSVLILHRLQWRKGTQNIYITSDEEIKMGDWHLVWLRDKWEVLNYMPSIGYRKECLGKEVCKIILTTDQDLIKDGVQEIDNEFLEWFVNNPSCEEVEVEIESKFDRVDGHYHDVWEIIIPKEEPKQDLLNKCTCLRPQTNCFSGMCSYCNRQIVKNLTTEDLKQKQETLEEVAEEYPKVFSENGDELFFDKQGYLIKEELSTKLHIGEVVDESYPKDFIKQEILEEAKKYAELSYYGDEVDAFVRGAKWQQERMYSEEDMKDYANYRLLIKKALNPKEWFEKFKNK